MKRVNSLAVFCLAAAGTIGSAGVASAQNTGYMKVVGNNQEKFQGQAQDPNHRGWIEIMSWSWGAAGPRAMIMPAPATTPPNPAAMVKGKPVGPPVPAAGKPAPTTQRATAPGLGQPEPSSGPGTVMITKRLDKSSPALEKAAVGGERLNEVIIEFVRPDKSQAPLRWKLENVMISSHHVSAAGGGDEMPTESISLNFTKISWESPHK